MKIIVAVIVHDRIENIKLWLNAWKQCEQHGAELVVIQNSLIPALLSRGRGDSLPYDIENLCNDNGVKHISRQNIGYDIGAFQDVCNERLLGFENDWDVLLWCTDDTFPMKKDFVGLFLKKLNSGVACAYLSAFVKKHIRTTGFAITKEVSRKIRFEKDPIVSKADCYDFEHKSKDAFYEQMMKLKIPVTQVDSWAKSPMWDSGYGRVSNRMKEHLHVFKPSDRPGLMEETHRKKNDEAETAQIDQAETAQIGKRDKVVFICPAYNTYPQIISSLINQTHKNWELFLLHDGPNETGMKGLVDYAVSVPTGLVNDPRIHYQETPKRTGNWGHHLRQWALKNLNDLCPDADYVVITNADNYHVPVYTEYLLKAFETHPAIVAAYCSDMVHSYKAWQIIPCRLQLGYIDCACVMVKKEVACEIGWRDIESHSSDWTYFSDIIKKYGTGKWLKVPGCLLIHN